VAGYCPYMFLPQTPFFHRFHGFLMKVTGAYPAPSVELGGRAKDETLQASRLVVLVSVVPVRARQLCSGGEHRTQKNETLPPVAWPQLRIGSPSARLGSLQHCLCIMYTSSKNVRNRMPE